MNSVELNGYKIYPFQSRTQFLDHLREEWNNILVALNAEKLMEDDEDLQNLVDNHIGYPDGIGAVFALKRKGYSAERIPGAEFWLGIISRYYKEKSFYLVGGKQKVIEKTVSQLREDFQGINIVGYRNGYMNSKEQSELIKDIEKETPDIVYVAMGSPKQEYLMQKMYKQHKALYMGLGGSFDIFCGIKERAPELFQKTGLEWFYRLLKEPSRIQRQIVYLPFLVKVITNRI